MNEKLKYININDLKLDQLWIEKNNNLLIDDVELLDEYSWQAISETLKPSLLVLNATDLSTRLREKIGESNIQPEVVIYPGKGAGQVKRRLGLFQNIPDYDIKASRQGPQDYPEISLPKGLEQRLQKRLDKSETLNVLVVDDVIGSGKTLEAVTLNMSDVVTNANQEPITDFEYYSRFRDRYISYGLPTYFAATWLIYASTLKYESYGSRIKSSPIAALVYKGENGKAPVNSMSTLLSPGTKEDRVRAAYGAKYSCNPVNFTGILKEIGGF